MTAVPKRHAALLDARRMSSLDAESFALVIEYLARHREVLSTRIVRLAGVRPFGPVGSGLRESLRISTTDYPVTLFSERLESLRWLNCEGHAAVIDSIERQALARGQSTRRRLAELIHECPSISREDAARTLGMSLRSFQRRICQEGSTFQADRAAGRVRLAQRRIMEGDAPLARIATEVGFNSPGVFSTVFRKVTGKSPREWRATRPIERTTR